MRMTQDASIWCSNTQIRDMCINSKRGCQETSKLNQQCEPHHTCIAQASAGLRYMSQCLGSSWKSAKIKPLLSSIPGRRCLQACIACTRPKKMPLQVPNPGCICHCVLSIGPRFCHTPLENTFTGMSQQKLKKQHRVRLNGNNIMTRAKTRTVNIKWHV